MEHLVALYGPAPCGTVPKYAEVLSVLMASDGIQADPSARSVARSRAQVAMPLTPGTLAMVH
jgi:hypothetical protein